ncbi:peroxide-responsive repressor PerR [bacterium BMS3Abin05]|nr:peroxide-responsive repressor PerR [bacterium BMS3Abin05]GBE27479.1 peroxide-responsive repressor PerR [bacterium BMS3Bbin03]HDL78727.1 transcriptional repressor [Bacteroidota bacterium]HDZ11811.1 transcriptional repressor [Bacteroidota bacterium]
MPITDTKRYKRSKQRERILEILKKTNTHPTADWIYNHLKKEYPKLSLGNVYRNLNILVNQGLVHELSFGSTFDHYDAHTEEHYHFICQSCGAILDLEMPYIGADDRKVEKMTGAKVHFHRTEFYGICKKCLDKNQ